MALFLYRVQFIGPGLSSKQRFEEEVRVWNSEEIMGILMTQLIQQRRNRSDEEFRKFVADAVMELSRDLRDFDIEVSVNSKPLHPTQRNARDWNPLHIGCE